MASESSFDIVSEFDRQELVNTLDQTRKEILNRFDFKDSKTTIELEKDKIIVLTEHTMRLEAIKTMLITKGIKRGLSPKIYDEQPEQPASGSMIRQEIKLRMELNQETAKKIVKLVKAEFPKIKISIQGETVRVADKSKDVLQDVMTFLKNCEDLEYPLQFTNYR